MTTLDYCDDLPFQPVDLILGQLTRTFSNFGSKYDSSGANEIALSYTAGPSPDLFVQDLIQKSPFLDLF